MKVDDKGQHPIVSRISPWHLVIIAFIAGGVVLGALGIHGWGWLIFLAVLGCIVVR